jgi:hypothetical protein
MIFKNDEIYDKIMYYSLENIFLFSMSKEKIFGNELKKNVLENKKIWKDILNFSTIK